MEIEFVGRHVAIGPVMQREIVQRLAPARRFLFEPVEMRVVLEAGEGEKRRFATEIHVAHRLGTLHARAESPDLGESVAEATAAVVEQARRGRQKLADSRRRAGRKEADRTEPAPAATEL